VDAQTDLFLFVLWSTCGLAGPGPIILRFLQMAPNPMGCSPSEATLAISGPSYFLFVLF
jgi:hypothetical protein